MRSIVISSGVVASMLFLVILCPPKAHSLELPPLADEIGTAVRSFVGKFETKFRQLPPLGEVVSNATSDFLATFGLKMTDLDLNRLKDSQFFGNLTAKFDTFRDSYNTTFAEYRQNITKFVDALSEAVKTGSTSGLKLFMNQCELSAVFEFPARAAADLVSNDARSVRQQILHRDLDDYDDYLKTVIPMYFSSLMYEMLCKELKETPVEGHVAIAPPVNPSTPKLQSAPINVDVGALSKGYFKRAVDEAKKVIVEEGGINEYTCKAVIRRLRANYSFANWTVGVYCNGCRETRLIPEYYKTSGSVSLDKEYLFKGTGNKENFYQVWANGKEFVFLTSAVGGSPSTIDWSGKMGKCVGSVSRTKFMASLFQTPNDLRSAALKDCVERLKLDFSVMGILEIAEWGCIEYDKNQAVASLVDENKFCIFGVDKKSV